jgi:hypothetical protein
MDDLGQPLWLWATGQMEPPFKYRMPRQNIQTAQFHLSLAKPTLWNIMWVFLTSVRERMVSGPPRSAIRERQDELLTFV